MYRKMKDMVGGIPRIMGQRILVFAVLVFTVGIVLTVTAATAEPVSIFDGSQTLTVQTFSDDAAKILKEAGIEYSAADEILFTTAEDGYRQLRLNRAFSVTITVGSNSQIVSVTGGTVKDALKKAGVTVDEQDSVNYSLDTPLQANMFIDVIQIDYQTETKEEAIAHNATTQYSAKLASGETAVTGGEDGVKLVTYRHKLVNGVLAESSVVEETVVKNPVDEVTVVGTKKAAKASAASADKAKAAKSSAVKTSADVKCISTLTPSSPIELDSHGRPVHYKQLITGKATAYTASPAARTSTGKQPQPGYIAVNPGQIPYGSRLYIKTADGSTIYGYSVAADTGGFASQGRILADLYFNTLSECLNFGVRNIEIYVLD